MLERRYYNMESLAENKDFCDSIDVLFIGNSSEFRAQKIPSLFKGKFSGKSFSINYDIENEKYSIQEFTNIFKVRSENLTVEGKDLIRDFIIDLEEIGINNKTILIDITSIKHPLVFYFILIFKNHFSPKNLFISYTEPEKYMKNNNDIIDDKFDLTERFCEVNSLPGFLRVVDYNKDRLLVTIMGFEGNRFNKCFNDINPANRKTYAIAGFPSFYPNWQYYVYSQNQNVLEQSKAYSLINRTTANEPFGIYNILKKIKKNNPQYEIYIAPLGTKPHSLGVSMFAVNNEDVQLYYDFPSYGKKIRTIGVGHSLLYNLTDFINEN